MEPAHAAAREPHVTGAVCAKVARGIRHLRAPPSACPPDGVERCPVGFAVGTVIHLGLDPVLEEADGIVRETQGLPGNLVPVLTLVGAGLGWWFAPRRAGPR